MGNTRLECFPQKTPMKSSTLVRVGDKVKRDRNAGFVARFLGSRQQYDPTPNPNILLFT